MVVLENDDLESTAVSFEIKKKQLSDGGHVGGQSIVHLEFSQTQARRLYQGETL